jgi:hypothetical protein
VLLFTSTLAQVANHVGIDLVSETYTEGGNPVTSSGYSLRIRTFYDIGEGFLDGTILGGKLPKHSSTPEPDWDEFSIASFYLGWNYKILDKPNWSIFIGPGFLSRSILLKHESETEPTDITLKFQGISGKIGGIYRFPRYNIGVIGEIIRCPVGRDSLTGKQGNNYISVKNSPTTDLLDARIAIEYDFNDTFAFTGGYTMNGIHINDSLKKYDVDCKGPFIGVIYRW